MKSILPAVLLVAVTIGLSMPLSGSFRPGPMLEPWNGLYRTARDARPTGSTVLHLEGMDAEARIEMDQRGVPHIFAGTDKDATIALGYAVARDRLFQMEFIYRAATGRLSEMLGEGALRIDRHFRTIGMASAVARNTRRLPEELPDEYRIAGWYAQGVNAWRSALSPSEWPLEYRLVGAEPLQYTPEFTMAILAYMTYDLSFRNSDWAFSQLKAQMGEAAFNQLFPEFDVMSVPIVEKDMQSTGVGSASIAQQSQVPKNGSESAAVIQPGFPRSQANFWMPDPPFEGFVQGKGSNNWAVAGDRSATGHPVLAGDMHLGLTLPAIWYEAHIVTPTRNVHGVTFPAAPAIVEGFTPTTAWAFTNTGSDQLDRYRLQLDQTGRRYLFDGSWRNLEFRPDTIHVRGGEMVVDTLIYSHQGPVEFVENEAIATRWVGHELGSTFTAIWKMNQATDYASFEDALRYWDYPMQNVLYAGSDDIIAIRSTGWLPIRGIGNAFGILDGTSAQTEWTGRVPFDELPFALKPSRGYLTSTNQRPAGSWYPWYLGQDWYSEYRSIRIDHLLSASEKHTFRDMASYQADVHAVQADLFLPWTDELEGLSDGAARVRDRLLGWDRSMSIDAFEPTLFSWFMSALPDIMWDEAMFKGAPRPDETRILDLLQDEPSSHWFDRVETLELVESWKDVFIAALDSAALRWADVDFTEVLWGEYHQLLLRHITQDQALSPLWRGPFPYPGWKETLSPGSSIPTTASASWRVVVDFSTSPPGAMGVYPGGQSGNPFSTHYDDQVGQFVNFDYFPLSLAATPEELRTVVE